MCCADRLILATAAGPPRRAAMPQPLALYKSCQMAETPETFSLRTGQRL